MVIFGTRPEAIKLFPVVQALSARDGLETLSCVSAQHREMLDQVLDIAGIQPNFDLDLMKSNQSLDDLTARLLTGIGKILDETKPRRVVRRRPNTTTAGKSAPEIRPRAYAYPASKCR